MVVPALILLAVVLLSGGGVALADRAKPGDALFGLDKAVEGFRLKVTASEEGTTRLKVRFAQERIQELKAIDPNDTQVVATAAEEVRSAVASADSAVEEIKLKVRLGGVSQGALDELQRLFASLLTIMREAGVVVGELKVEIKDDELKVKLKALEEELEDETEVDDLEEMELKGVLQQAGTGFQIIVEGKTFTLAGPIDLAPFVGKIIKVEGRLAGTILTVEELKVGVIKVETEDNRVEIKLTGIVTKADAGFRVTAEGVTFTLMGPLATGGLFTQVVDKHVEIKGILTGTDIAVTKIEADRPERVKLEVEDEEDEDEEDEDELDLDVKNEVRVRVKQRGGVEVRGGDIKLRGILEASGADFTVTVAGKTFTLHGSGLTPFVGQRVKVEGTVRNSTVRVREIKTESAGPSSGDADGDRDDKEDDDEENDDKDED